MTFYPMYFPMYMGGGPRNNKEGFFFLVMYGAVLGGFVMLFKREVLPNFQMKMIQKNNYSANVEIRQKGYSKIKRITNHNIECLKNKGYTVDEESNKFLYSSWSKQAYLETVDTTNRYLPKVVDLPKEKLIRDCKECNVHSEIVYEYDNIFGNEKQAKKKLYWHKCYIDELK